MIYPRERSLALGIQGIVTVLQKDQLHADTADGYTPLSTFDRERLLVVLELLAGELVDGAESHPDG